MFEKAIACVEAGIEKREFSCAALAIGCGKERFVRHTVGASQAEPFVIPATDHTLFDLASLSKLVSTTMIALRFLEEGVFALHDSVSLFFADCGNFGTVTIKELMTHTSGISPHIALYNVCASPEDALHAILHAAPVCARGEQVRYSCMGYILLAKILEKIAGKSLDVLAQEHVFSPLGMKSACYNPVSDDVATTEFSRYHNHWVRGHVHDENAHYLGGISGNAGVFASIDDMISFASMLSMRGRTPNGIYLTPRTFDLAVRNYTPDKDESRGLGFQLMGRQYSPMGDLMSLGSYGHTGFTGTSLYVDTDTGLYVLLLTNAVHFGRENRGAYFQMRRRLHNMIVTEYCRSKAEVLL